jgi:hypothetical protein
MVMHRCHSSAIVHKLLCSIWHFQCNHVSSKARAF